MEGDLRQTANMKQMYNGITVINLKTKVLGENPVPLPLSPSQIQHRLVWDGASAVRL